MKKFIASTTLFFRDQEGATAVEYAVVLGFIIAACAVGYRLIGESTNGNLALAENCFNP